MSPSLGTHHRRTPSFPRVSGDEPTTKYTLAGLGLFSPRERG